MCHKELNFATKKIVIKKAIRFFLHKIRIAAKEKNILHRFQFSPFSGVKKPAANIKKYEMYFCKLKKAVNWNVRAAPWALPRGYGGRGLPGLVQLTK